jgi:hypothetical protein
MERDDDDGTHWDKYVCFFSAAAFNSEMSAPVISVGGI